MAQLLDFQITEPRSRFNQSTSFVIPSSRVRLATIRLTIPRSTDANNNKVELIATVGVRGVTGIAQIRFRIFRDGIEIFNTQQGVESAGSEQNYVITFQAADIGVRSGSHTYTVTAENMTAGTTARVVGPISFSGLAIRTSQ